MDHTPTSPIQQIAVIGTYLPRHCGIATFSADFSEALARQFSDANIFAIAINDGAETYAYPARVRFEIAEGDIESYRRAADFLNTNGVDLVVLQHEYGIFGGLSGGYILELLRNVRAPVVTMLHTVLRDPDPTQRQVMEEIVRLSDRLVVMSDHARDVLIDFYQTPPRKVTFIPHGIPDVPFVDPNFYKDQFDAEGKSVLLSFGLLSPNKGIEYAIAAMPAILEQHPNALYVVLGATHPHVRRAHGEAYRLELQRLARELGVEQNVVFYDQFVPLEELVEWIGAADIYVTPYLNPEQVVSGTLSYTVGAGKAVISTPYAHAEELLGEGRGALVPFRDSAAIAQRVIELLGNDAARHAMRKRAYMHGREMIWPRVAERYQRLFLQVLDGRLLLPRSVSGSYPEAQSRALPPLRLGHLRRMTDDTGLTQHATFSVPNYREGYSIDDNARGLIAAVFLEKLGSDEPEMVEDLTTRYLAFLSFAFNGATGRFRNMLAYDRRWLEDQGSEDSHGRALWSLGVTIGRSTNQGWIGLANSLFGHALPAAMRFTSPRAWAFTLLGLQEYLKRFGEDRDAQRARDELAARLMRLYEASATAEWPWFEDRLTYDNATLPRALLLAGHAMGQAGYVEAAVTALTWLERAQSGAWGQFTPVGCLGFYQRGEARARFDQQPIEAYATTAAYLDAFRVTGDEEWRQRAEGVFGWFLGANDLHTPMFDAQTGACFDGLQPNWVNQNQGAESTLAFLLSSLELRLAEAEEATEEAAREADLLLSAGVAPASAAL
ncbi:MAG TPA: glycosyltransferase family 4 protein [Ktedonobacterales bacterium]|nr:glycosyltransferase family 4 protein [Ktedonobacterales bacterium]